MADNDLQDMVRQIEKTLPRRLGDMTPDDLKNHLVDVHNNPTQYGLPGFDTPGVSSVIAKAEAQIEGQHTAIQKGQVEDFLKALDTASQQSGKDPATLAQEWRAEAAGYPGPGGDDPGGDVIMDIGLEAVDAPPTGPPNIDDLFEPTLGPNPTLPGTLPPMDPDLEELLKQTDALRPPSDPAPQEGIDVPTFPGDATAAVPMDDPTSIGAPGETGMMPEGGGSGHTGSGEPSGFNC